MANTNSWTVSGNLTRDPDLRSTQGGTDVTNMGVAVNGFRDDDTQFVDVSVWGKQAKACAEHLSKGSYVVVTGRGKLRTWEGKDGQTRATVQIDARDVEFGPKSGGSQAAQNGSQQAAAQPAQQQPAQQTAQPAAATGGDDDIPF